MSTLLKEKLCVLLTAARMTERMKAGCRRCSDCFVAASVAGRLQWNISVGVLPSAPHAFISQLKPNWIQEFPFCFWRDKIVLQASYWFTALGNAEVKRYFFFVTSTYASNQGSSFAVKYFQSACSSTNGAETYSWTKICFALLSPSTI